MADNDWLNENTQLPLRNYYALDRHWARLTAHVGDYRLSAINLELTGTTFEDLMGDGLGSTAKLRENAGTYFEDGVEKHYFDLWNIDAFFIPPVWDGGWLGFWAVWWDQYGAPILKDEAADLALLTSPFFFLDSEKRFQRGMIVRCMIRFAQLRIAKTLENIFCLDQRGRPPQE